MTIYIVNILMMLFWSLVFRPGESNRGRFWFVLLCTCQLALLAGLRAENTCKDMAAYRMDFESLTFSSIAPGRRTLGAT